MFKLSPIKFSLNVKKTRYTFLNKSNKKGNIQLDLPKLAINGKVIARTVSIKFLEILLDKHLLWNEYTNYIQNKIAKYIGILYRAKQYLYKKSLLALYYFYSHSYISYGNIAWASTNVTNLKKKNNQQKHAIWLANNKGIFSHLWDLLRFDKNLNVYQLNILNFITVVHRFQRETSRGLFLSKFQKLHHKYSKNFGKLNYQVRPIDWGKAKFVETAE